MTDSGAAVRPGDTCELARVLTQDDFDAFARISGDDNPIHVDPAFAATTRFGRTLAHGMHLFGTLAAAMHVHFPGPGTKILDQKLKFPGPTFAGDALTVRLEVLDVDGSDAVLSTTITRSDGSVSCEGEATVRLPESKTQRR